MTPAQMLAHVEGEKKQCEPCEVKHRVHIDPTAVLDFASIQGLDPYKCVKKGFCPICGFRGQFTFEYANHQIEWFECNGKNSHTFEVDHESETADRLYSKGH